MNTESTHDARRVAMRAWLRGLGEDAAGLSMVAGDASFRRYFRLQPQSPKNRALAPTWIIMDAPPAMEDTRPFLQVRALLAEHGLQVPTLIAENAEDGFLALGDLGDQTLSITLAEKPDEAFHADPYYRAALKDLVQLQQINPAALPAYDASRLQQELMLFPEWFLTRHLGVDFDRVKLDAAFATLIDNLLRQPAGLVHRDYHSRNLMVLAAATPATPAPQLGMLDFQDAVVGPLTYDVVSLLRDAYVFWPEHVELDWLVRYWEVARHAGLPLSPDFATFYRDYEWTGLQRHLKILGIFARLHYRDGKARYLDDLPRVLTYAQNTARRYREFGHLSQLLESL